MSLFYLGKSSMVGVLNTLVDRKFGKQYNNKSVLSGDTKKGQPMKLEELIKTLKINRN